MAPGVDGLPAAAGPARPGDLEPDGAIDTVSAIDSYLASLPHRAVRQVKLALWALELLPFPWRFSRASVDARQGVLAKLEGARLPFAADLLLFLKVLAGLGYGNDPRVRAAVGYEMRCEVSDGMPPLADAPHGLGDMRPEPGGEECDVAIVGSGAGGAACAAILADAGLDVLVLEAGPYMDSATYPDEPLAALKALYRDGGLTIAEGRPAIPTPVGRAVGGTTVINSGTCFRAPDEVLAGWRDRHGIEWATELAGYYAEAEEVMWVRPVDPERMGRNGQLLREGAEALGARHGPLSRNAGGCYQCSSCPSGCRLDAKRAAHVSYLPRAVGARAPPPAPRPPRRRPGGPRGPPPAASCSTAAGRRASTAWRDQTAGCAPSPSAPSGPSWWRAEPLGLRSCCSGRDSGRRAASWAATFASTRRAGSAPGSTRRFVAGTGSCRAMPSRSGNRGGSFWRRPSLRSRSEPSGFRVRAAPTRSAYGPTTTSHRPAFTYPIVRPGGWD